MLGTTTVSGEVTGRGEPQLPDIRTNQKVALLRDMVCAKPIPSKELFFCVRKGTLQKNPLRNGNAWIDADNGFVSVKKMTQNNTCDQSALTGRTSMSVCGPDVKRKTEG